MILNSWPLTLSQTLYNILLAAISAYTIYYIYYQLTTGTRHRTYILTHACKPPKTWYHWDPILGLDFLYEFYKSVKAHNLLEKQKERFEFFGAGTAQVRIFGQRLVATVEPENLKTVLSLRFGEWGVGEERKRVMIPFLGEGILEVDGLWGFGFVFVFRGVWCCFIGCEILWGIATAAPRKSIRSFGTRH